MSGFGCNKAVITEEVLKNKDKITTIINHYNNLMITPAMYGEIKGIEDNTPAVGYLEEFLRDVHPKLVLDENYVLTKTEVNLIKLRLNQHEKQMQKPLGYLESQIKIPVAVLRKTPGAKRFYEQLDLAKNYERNATIDQAKSLKLISKAFRHAYQVGALESGFMGLKTFKKLQTLENSGRLEEDPAKLHDIATEVESIIMSDEGALIRDFVTLLQTPEKLYSKTKAAGIRGEVYGAKIEQDAGRFGKAYNPHIQEAVDQARLYLNEMGKVNINALPKLLDAVFIKATGKSRKDAKAEVLYMPELERLTKNVNEAIERLKIGITEGGYFPQIALSEIMELKARFNEILNSDRGTNMSKLIDDTAADLQTMIQINPPSNVKARNDLVQRRWAQNPMFVLEQYGAQAIQFNKLNTIATEYQKVLKVISNPNMAKANYMKGLAEYLHDEYTIATKGLANRPEWLNKTVRTLKIAETLYAMGFGVVGATKNVASAHFFFVNMGLSSIRKSYDMYSNGRLKVKATKDNPTGETSVSELVKSIEREQGFGFGEIGTELVTDGILSKEGAEKLDFRFNVERGTLEAKPKDSPQWQTFESLMNWTTNKLLIFHRWGENYSRKWMFRLGLVEALEGYRQQTAYWNAKGGNTLTPRNWKTNDIARKAINVALWGVNRFAGEYAMHAKSRILTGHPGRMNVNHELINKTEVGATTLTSLATGLMHYPMFFTDTQYKILENTVHRAMAGEWDHAESKYLVKYATFSAFISGLSVLFGGNLHNVFENEDIRIAQEMYRNIQGPDADELNPDGSLKDEAKGYYGIMQLATSVIPQKTKEMSFKLMLNHGMSFPDSELSHILFGYDRYLSTKSPEARERYRFNQLGTFFGFMANKAVPALRDGRGWDIPRHMFRFYPAQYIKDIRQGINTLAPSIWFGQPFFKEKKKRRTTVSGLGAYAVKAKSKTKGGLGRQGQYTSLEQWRHDIELTRNAVRRNSIQDI